MAHNTAYQKDIIAKAKKLYESGATYQAVSKEVGINRWQTIFDWAQKYSWKRNLTASNFIFCNKKDIQDLELAGRKCIAYALDKDSNFKNITEAIDVLEKIRKFLDVIHHLSQNTEEVITETEEMKGGKNILSLLAEKKKRERK